MNVFFPKLKSQKALYVDEKMSDWQILSRGEVKDSGIAYWSVVCLFLLIPS